MDWLEALNHFGRWVHVRLGTSIPLWDTGRNNPIADDYLVVLECIARLQHPWTDADRWARYFHRSARLNMRGRRCRVTREAHNLRLLAETTRADAEPDHWADANATTVSGQMTEERIARLSDCGDRLDAGEDLRELTVVCHGHASAEALLFDAVLDALARYGLSGNACALAMRFPQLQRQDLALRVGCSATDFRSRLKHGRAYCRELPEQQRALANLILVLDVRRGSPSTSRLCRWLYHGINAL